MALIVSKDEAFGAILWVRNKYALESHESSVALTEQEFECKILWNQGFCFLEFNNEPAYVWFVLTWL